MFKPAGLVGVVIVGFLVAAVGAQEVKDAVVADPEAHQVILENEHVRVLRAFAAVGHQSPMHSHPPLLVVSLGSARVRFSAPDGQKQIVDLHPGQAFWIDGTEHSWELLAGEIDIVAVEVKAAKAPKKATE